MIGVGNAARGDDAAGLVAARRLGGVELEGDPIALLDLLEGVDDAVVIDATRSGAAPGTIQRIDARAGTVAAIRGSSSTHAVGLAEAIELARALGRLPARVRVYGIEGERFDLGAGISAPVVTAIERLVAELRR